MRHPHLDSLMAEQRHQDDLRAAEQHRLVKLALGDRRPGFSIRLAALALSRALAYLGEHLLEWSARLQCRYRVLAAASPETQPEPCA